MPSSIIAQPAKANHFASKPLQKLLFSKKIVKSLLYPKFVYVTLLTVLSSLLAKPMLSQELGNTADTTGKQLSPAIDSTSLDTLPPIQTPAYLQDRYGNPFSLYSTESPFLLPHPKDFKQSIELDSEGQYFEITEQYGKNNFRTPSQVPFEVLRNIKFNKDIKNYWRNISISQDKAATLPEQRNKLIPTIKIGSVGKRLFGGDEININLNGSLLLDFGGRFQTTENPSIPLRQQRNGSFNFDQQVGLSFQGNVGKKLSIKGNFDTKSTFQFNQNIKFAYKNFEEDIIQHLDFGNINFPVKNSLIKGAHNLFGIGARLRFGKLYLNTVFSNQRGSSEELIIKNGGQTREFAFKADQYDANRHFFLGHFFRNRYEQALKNLPNVDQAINLTRVEVYITNRDNNTETLRNFVAFADLGEQNPANQAVMQLGVSSEAEADNGANELFRLLSNEPEARKQGDIINALSTIDATLADSLQNGRDFEILNGARKLEQGREYTIHQQLGYISLNRPLRNDEVLAVSYVYTNNNVTKRVGELTEDYQGLGDEEVIFLKLLKPSIINTNFPTWDLMMKNTYRLNVIGLKEKDFQMRIFYKDDLTGQDNPSLHEGGPNIKDIPLIRLTGLDRLNKNRDPQPDGNFDFVEGLTVNAQNALLYFTVLEPFGSHLRSLFESADDTVNKQVLINRYVYDDLYRETQADATLNTARNKFILKGSYSAGAANQIQLPGIDIAEGSVIITVGSTKLNEAQYRVDYDFGKVTILDQGILSTGEEIKVSYEKSDIFNTQPRILAGVDAEYHLSKDIKLTGTFMHLNERPILSRVRIGEEPATNTVWGLGVSYQSSSRFLTKVVDALPFLSTKAESKLSFDGEFAQILPSSAGLLGEGGVSYIDDFEFSEVPYSLESSPNENWHLGSIPDMILQQSPQTEVLGQGFKRAKLAWYSIDNSFYFSGGIASRPQNLTDEDLQNHYVRNIGFNEVFPNRQQGNIGTSLERSFDLAFYPTERGPYNFNTNLTAEGELINPEQNFGAITRAIDHNNDFDNINIQYIEFWLMNPFINGVNGQVEGENNTTGGQLYFNLGNISEDVIPDGRHFFENGLMEEPGFTDFTEWGQVPNTQYIQNVFSGNRDIQDVGLDGLTDEQEASPDFFADYLSAISGQVSQEAFNTISADPSADNFRHFLGEDLDNQDIGILERYKDFNGTQNNSPINQGTAFTPSSRQMPDNEDLNRDNTLSTVEQYYQYKVELRPDLLSINHPFIVDQVRAYIEASDDSVTWYQFRIPIRDNPEVVNGISGFKSIRYIRTFLTGWSQPVVLRFVDMQLVGAQWRAFEQNLPSGNGGVKPEAPAVFDITTVNIEENGQSNEGSIPYTLPPGVIRDRDPTSLVLRQRNEQSIQLCVSDLPEEDGVGIFKNVQLDFINYERLQMFVHAQSDEASNDDLHTFIRIGTDFEENYYEISWNLRITPRGSIDPAAIWPAENSLDVAFEDLSTIKVRRNRVRGRTDLTPYKETLGRYRIKIVGNPDLSDIQTVILGVRNNSSANAQAFDACLWFNELRVSGFDRQKGWATRASVDLKLADFASVKAGISYNTFGYGGVQEKLRERARESTLSYNVSASISLDKILLHKIGLKLPLYVSYQRSTTDPKFDPRDKDVTLQASLNSFDTETQQSNYLQTVRFSRQKRSISLTNVRKIKLKPDGKSHFWDIENLSFSGSYTDEFRRDLNTFAYRLTQWNLSTAYTYNFNTKPLEPFKNIKWLNSPYLRLIKDFNISLSPSSLSVRGTLNRNFTITQLRNSNLDTVGILPNYEKTFTFDRNYNMRWDFTKSINFTYDAQANAIIDDPTGELDDPIAERDSLVKNLKNLGRLKAFNQSVAANYTLPFNKFPLTSWLKANLGYKANYIWTSGATDQIETFGHSAANTNNIAANANIDLNKVYNKIPILKDINAFASSGGSSGRGRENITPTDPLESKLKRIQKKLTRIEEKIKKRRDKEKNKLEEKFQKEPDEGSEKTASTLPAVPADSLIIPKYLLKKKRKIELIVKEIQEHIEQKKTQKKKKQKKHTEYKLAKGLGAVILSIKKIDVSYNQTNGTNISGFSYMPFLFGLHKETQAPSLPFILGVQDANIIRDNRDWLVISDQNHPFKQSSTEKISFKTSLTPIKDLKINLSAERSRTSGFSELYRYDTINNQFIPINIQRTGSFNSSFALILTAFSAGGAEGLFDKFSRNRDVIFQRLSLLNENQGSYDTTSQDVLIPAFVAAYAGHNVDNVGLSAFPAIPIPNWQITYSGLKNIPFFKERLKNISISHSYNSSYSVGNYTSNELYNTSIYRDNLSLDVNERNFISPISRGDTSVFTPLFTTDALVINERFSPLIGVNFTTKNNIQFKINYNKSREFTLGLTNPQVNETSSKDISLEVSFNKKGLKLPFKINGQTITLDNDLNFRFNLTLRDTRTVQRRFDQPGTITEGSSNLQIKPTISYVLNKWGNLQVYFEHAFYSPRISRSFPRRTTAFGVQLRVNLNEL